MISSEIFIVTKMVTMMKTNITFLTDPVKMTTKNQIHNIILHRIRVTDTPLTAVTGITKVKR